MPNAAINARVAPDTAPTPQTTIDPGRAIDHCILDVFNSAIYWQVKEYTPPLSPRSGYWTTEVYMPPGSRTLDRATLCGVRFRAAIPTAQLPAGTLQAVVTCEAVM